MRAYFYIKWDTLPLSHTYCRHHPLPHCNKKKNSVRSTCENQVTLGIREHVRLCRGKACLRLVMPIKLSDATGSFYFLASSSWCVCFNQQSSFLSFCYFPFPSNLGLNQQELLISVMGSSTMLISFLTRLFLTQRNFSAWPIASNADRLTGPLAEL